MSNNQQADWVSHSKHFARIPLEILSAGLTLNELQLFIALASFAHRNGNLGHFTKCQKTLGELLGWINKSTGEGNNKWVSDTLRLLKDKGLVTTKKRSGNNRGIDYQLHLPFKLQLRPTIDRSTPEYLALAEAKRQAVKEIYKAKTLKEINRRTAGIEFNDGDTVSDGEAIPDIPEKFINPSADEVVTYSVAVVDGFEDLTIDLYQEEYSKISYDHSALLADPIIKKNLLGMSDENFKKRILDAIADRYPDFIDMEPHQKHEAFFKQFRILNR